MSYALSGSADNDDNYCGNKLLDQADVGTASKHRKELDVNTSWLLQDSPNYYRNRLTSLNNSSETISGNNKNRNNETRKPKMRKVLLSKEYRYRCDTAPKYTGVYRPKGYRLISQGAQDVMGKPISRNDSSRPKYVVTKRDPKLRPLEEVAPRKFKRREQLVIRNDQQASCSTKKLQKQERTEKTTYCRPILDFVNEDSVAKTAERNNRLQNIVQKLIEVRQIQKQRETWNNFINELKTRHEVNTVHTNENELINDYSNLRFNVQPTISKPVRYYIEDMYPHSSSMVEQEIKSNIYDYQSKFDNSHLLYGAQPYLCYPNISMRGKTSKPANNTYDYIICSERNRHDNDVYAPRQKYKRKTAYIPSDTSMPSKDSDYDYTLTDNEENLNRGGRKSKYRQQADRVASRRTTYNNEMVQNHMTPNWLDQRNQAIKNNTERRKYRSSITNKAKSNVSDDTLKQKQMQGQYKQLFKDIATYKEQNQDDNSNRTLENIENKLDLLLQGISELLQEIKPKCNLINENHEIKEVGQYFEDKTRCRDCIGNDTAFRERVPKRETTKYLCKNPQRRIKKYIDEVDDDILDKESDRCCKPTFSFKRSNQFKNCNSHTDKLLEAYYDKYKQYDDERGNECDICSVQDNPLVEEYDRIEQDDDERGNECDICCVQDNPLVEKYDRIEQDDDSVIDGEDQASTSYYLKNEGRARTSLVEQNENSREQSRRNVQEEDSYGLNGAAQDVEFAKCKIRDEMNNEICSKFYKKQAVDEAHKKRKNNHYANNKDNGTEKRKSCIVDTWNKRKKSGDLSQQCDERCLKFKIESNEIYDKFGVIRQSEYEKKPLQEHAYAKDQLHAPTTPHCLPSSCRQQKSREPRLYTNHTSEINRPLSERRSSCREIKCDHFRDMFKNIRRQELEKQRQNSSDEMVSRLKGEISGHDTCRQRCWLQKKIKKPESAIVTGTLSKSGPNAERRKPYDVQEYIKQTWSYETETCQKHEVEGDASDARIVNESQETNNEKDVCLVVGISRDSDTKFRRKINKDIDKEQGQGCLPMLCLQGGLGHDEALDKNDDMLESCSNFRTRKLIDDGTSVNRVLNVSRGSSTDKSEENTHRFKKEDQYTCAVVKSHGSPFCNKHRYENSKMDKIIIEEMNKSDQAKKDIEDILNGEFSNACSLSFTFDMPTRERATEVTNSLSAAVPHGENDLYSYDSSSRTITTVAVNTDPMGLLALLRLSTDTLRYLLGQMNLDRIYSPLAYITQFSVPRTLPLPSLASIQSDIPGFICNICGSAFPSRSQLSLHNVDHRNDIYRGCCVCRHLLDMRKRRHTGLFTCVYCGQCFTRAYCCELHQHVCARKRGLKHDAAEKLSILR